MRTANKAPDNVIYKIMRVAEWEAALTAGSYHGSEDDRRDGFIHLSNSAQLDGTARKHFAGRTDLVLVAFRSRDLGAELRWEPSRGGALFPHLYGALDPTLALWTRALTLDADGVPQVAAARRAAGEYA